MVKINMNQNVVVRVFVEDIDLYFLMNFFDYEYLKTRNPVVEMTAPRTGMGLCDKFNSWISAVYSGDEVELLGRYVTVRQWEIDRNKDIFYIPF